MAEHIPIPGNPRHENDHSSLHWLWQRDEEGFETTTLRKKRKQEIIGGNKTTVADSAFGQRFPWIPPGTET